MEEKQMDKQQRREWFLTFIRELIAQVDDDWGKAWLIATLHSWLYRRFLDYALYAMDQAEAEDIAEMTAEAQRMIESICDEHFSDIGDSRFGSKAFRPSRN